MRRFDIAHPWKCPIASKVEFRAMFKAGGVGLKGMDNASLLCRRRDEIWKYKSFSTVHMMVFDMRRLVLSGIVCGLLGCALFASSEQGGRSPLQTIELLHKALRDA